jgi:hypothetical protein
MHHVYGVGHYVITFDTQSLKLSDPSYAVCSVWLIFAITVKNTCNIRFQSFRDCYCYVVISQFVSTVGNGDREIPIRNSYPNVSRTGRGNYKIYAFAR